MRNGKTVFVDCNDTLIAVRHANRGDVVPEGFKSIERGGQWYHVQARPSADAFLKAVAADECNLVVLTGGSTRIQHLLLALTDLDEELDQVIGFESTGRVELPPSWVLVDDLQGGSSSFEEKLAMLGFKRKDIGEARYKALVEKHCIQCRSFKGGEDSAPLTGLLEEVHTKLAA
ncbi:MAG: NIF family HAD-type phosphatase [Candidatus Obscuribacterales bacterium]|jgi:hypothetical protein